MKNRIALAAAAALVLGVAGHASAQDRHEHTHNERRPLPSQGEPGLVAAADIAFARAARDDGQWTAFRRFAADGAVMHGENGIIEAGPFLATRADPPAPVQWSPTAVWTSCDGSTAVSFGRFQEPDGIIGSYVTVWELQSNREYKWVYDMGGADDPQPAPRLPPVEDSIDMIVVPGMDIIDGKVADCSRGSAPDAAMPAEVSAATHASRDGTLRWQWSHGEDGTRLFVLHYLRDGTWQTPLTFTPGE